MLRKLAEKYESKKEKYDDIDDDTKEVEINKVAETNLSLMKRTTLLLLRTP